MTQLCLSMSHMAYKSVGIVRKYSVAGAS
jgi:hypothetical protein